MNDARRIARELRAYIEEDEGDLSAVADAADLLIQATEEREAIAAAWRAWDGKLGTPEYYALEKAIVDGEYEPVEPSEITKRIRAFIDAWDKDDGSSSSDQDDWEEALEELRTLA